MKASFQFAVRSLSLGALILMAGCLGSEEQGDRLGVNDGTSSANTAPTISGVPSSSVRMGDAYSFTPSASDADNDPLTFSIERRPSWLSFNDANGALRGTPTLADVGTYTGIVVSVSDGSASSSLPQFSVDVVQNADGSITISWTAPTQNEDGSVLTDLDAYKIYYGTSPGRYSNQVRINNGGLTTYVLENLAPDTYYIVATAINSSGMESRFSSEISKQIL